eukprot:COSAG04_NODE_2932_length_3374_cov_1.917863_3_plen_68_part_00
MQVVDERVGDAVHAANAAVDCLASGLQQHVPVGVRARLGHLQINMVREAFQHRLEIVHQGLLEPCHG